MLKNARKINRSFWFLQNVSQSSIYYDTENISKSIDSPDVPRLVLATQLI